MHGTKSKLLSSVKVHMRYIFFSFDYFSSKVSTLSPEHKQNLLRIHPLSGSKFLLQAREKIQAVSLILGPFERFIVIYLKIFFLKCIRDGLDC